MITLNNFQVPNVIWDMDMDIYERGVLTHIIRKTIGWGKEKDGISLSQFCSDLGISKNKVISTLKSLESKRLIKIDRNRSANNAKTFNKYSLSKDIEMVVHEVNKVVHDKDKGSAPQVLGVVHDKDIQKNTNTKNTRQIKKQTKKKNNFENFLETIENLFEANKVLTHSAKINSTDKTKKYFKLIAVDDLLTVASDYTRYVVRNKGKAVRLDKYLIARYEGNLDAIDYGIENKQEKSLSQKIKDSFSQEEIIDAEIQ